MKYLLAILIVLGLTAQGNFILAEDSDGGLGTAGQGAVVGASTQVVTSTALDALTAPQPQYVRVQGPDGQYYWQEVHQQESATSKILKRAITGAVTGAVAASMSKDSKEGSTSFITNTKATKILDEAQKVAKAKGKNSKEDFRPPGWDKGRKEGWNDGDIPPGLRGKNKK